MPVIYTLPKGLEVLYFNAGMTCGLIGCWPDGTWRKGRCAICTNGFYTLTFDSPKDIYSQGNTNIYNLSQSISTIFKC